MSKNKKFDDDDEYNNSKFCQELKQHRKDKKIKNALRNNNINFLIDDDDDYQ